MNRKLNLSETVSSVLLFTFGLHHLARGVFWVLADKSTRHDSQMYLELETIMPLYVWGMICSIGAVFFLLASISLPHHQTSRSFALFLIMGGSISGAFYFVIAIFGFHSAINWFTPLQLVVLSAGSAMLAFFGGVVLWKKRIT